MLFDHVCAIKHDTKPILSFYGVFLFNVSSLHLPLNRNTSLEFKQQFYCDLWGIGGT